MVGRAPHPMPDFEHEAPGKVDDVVVKDYKERKAAEREYREREAKEDKRPVSDFNIQCHSLPSTVGRYPLNPAQCEVSTLDWNNNGMQAFGPNTVGDRRAAAKHGNPSRDPQKAYGDTPEGTYLLEQISQGKHGKSLYVDLLAVGGPAARAHRDNSQSIDLHTGRVTNGCFGATHAELEGLVDRLAGTSKGTLVERVKLANEKIKKERVLLHHQRDLPITIPAVPLRLP